MRLRAAFTLGLAVLCLMFVAPFASGSAGAYPITTCSTLSVSTTNPLPGASITVGGSNFTPGASVTLLITPGNTTLATATADSDGKFSVQVTLPANATNNEHFVITATSGAVSATSCPVDPFQSLQFQADTISNGGSTTGGSSGGGLSVTGLDIAGLLALAAGLIGAGVLLNRKRTTKVHSGRY